MSSRQATLPGRAARRFLSNDKNRKAAELREATVLRLSIQPVDCLHER
jgi:hypothetical protein